MDNLSEARNTNSRQDFLTEYGQLFHNPFEKGAYLCGNSLGLMPKTTPKYILEELHVWQTMAVEGHFRAPRPWYAYQNCLNEPLARLLGALPQEVVAMNTLTVNLHLLMASFYRPTPQKYKILIEAGAFGSDRYAVATHAQHHGFDPKEAVIELAPQNGEHILKTEHIVQVIKQNAEQLALVLFSGVQYYTGQWFDMKTIAQAAHQYGVMVGFDLAHAAGNVPMELHNWDIDFAAWCSYKYLNSGPGGVGGAFVHQKHGDNPNTLRFGGWWGIDEKTRFDMPHQFVPQAGAAGWQLSNVPILNMAAHLASLEIFDQVGIQQLRKKSLELTAFAETTIDHINKQLGQEILQIITPKDPQQRGCQLSVRVPQSIDRSIVDELAQQHIILDWRKPNVLRFAPVPLYNSFDDIDRFGQQLLKNLKKRFV